MSEEYKVVEMSHSTSMAGHTFYIKNWDDFIKAIKLNNVKTVFKSGKEFFFPLEGVVIRCKYKK